MWACGPRNRARCMLAYSDAIPDSVANQLLAAKSDCPYPAGGFKHVQVFPQLVGMVGELFSTSDLVSMIM